MADGLAARQWEAYLADDRIRGGEAAWISPGTVGYRSWAAQLWLAGGENRPVPLTPLQSTALWRQIVAESQEGRGLIGSEGAGDWAADAWDLLCNWRLDPSKLRANDHQPDFRAFLNWCRSYRDRLEESGWIDQPRLDALLPTEPLESPAHLVLADLADLSPAREALLGRLEQSGCRIERWTAPQVEGTRHRIAAADSDAELHAAARWACRQLADQPGARIALVVADLQTRYLDVERALENLLAPELIWHGAQRLTSDPQIGAALNAIELVTPRATFATFSRWLRSPFVEGIEPAERAVRALLEQRLRGQIAAQLGFGAAYREAGLAEPIKRYAPAVATALDLAFNEIGATRTATPSRWAKLWERALTRLGWSTTHRRADDPTLLGWQAAIDDLAQLTPILGTVPANRALHELTNIVQRRRTAAALPLAGVHVFARIDDVGPGYHAAWVTGFTDAQWPQPARSNPLLPRQFQREQRMPWHSPQDTRDRSARSLRRLFERVPALVMSWPARVFDYPTEPSPAIRMLPELAPSDGEEGSAARSFAHRVQRARETLVDAPPPLPGRIVTGGVGALNRQARCPLRAFCEYRLAAKEIEPISRGLSARIRGIAAHRALELLLQARPAQAELARITSVTIDQCVERALLESFANARAPLHALFELERERLNGLIVELLDRDAQRAAFAVDTVEQREEIRFGQWTLRVRIDRRDRLAAGGMAVIDYKTGAKASSSDWLKDRLGDTQVPIYAVHAAQIGAAERVDAAVIAHLQAGATGYQGFWQPPDSFPGHSRRLPNARTWPEQLAAWREQIAALIEEFTSGDTRILPDSDLDDVRRGYGPLTRATEQIALARGLLAPW